MAFWGRLGGVRVGPEPAESAPDGSAPPDPRLPAPAPLPIGSAAAVIGAVALLVTVLPAATVTAHAGKGGSGLPARDRRMVG